MGDSDRSCWVPRTADLAPAMSRAGLVVVMYGGAVSAGT